MKLTKTQVKQMIKEEMNELMGMMGEPPGKSKEELLQEIMGMLQSLEQEQLSMVYTNLQEMLSNGMIEENMQLEEGKVPWISFLLGFAIAAGTITADQAMNPNNIPQETQEVAMQKYKEMQSAGDEAVQADQAAHAKATKAGAAKLQQAKDMGLQKYKDIWKENKNKHKKRKT